MEQGRSTIASNREIALHDSSWNTSFSSSTDVDVTVRYCQRTGMIASSLLLLMEEEDAFWILCTIVEGILPASYCSSTLLGTFCGHLFMGMGWADYVFSRKNGPWSLLVVLRNGTVWRVSVMYDNLMFIGPCIIVITEESKNQLDAAGYFVALLIGFNVRWWWVSLVWVAGSSLSPQPGRYSSPTAPHLEHTANQERNDQCGKQHHSRELLMMGIVMLGTCWAYK